MTYRILFVHTGNESFVRLDRGLIQRYCIVKDFHVPRRFPSGGILLWRAIKNVDVVFCWFASWNSLWALLFARIMRKGTVLVIGGYDLANLPEANYGHQHTIIGKWVSRCAMKFATNLFTNSYYSQKEAQLNVGIPPKQVRVIYHGVPDEFGEVPSKPKERIVLTVGKVEWPNLKRKGLEPFVRAAAYQLDVKFILIGSWADDSIDYLRSIASPNVCFTGYVGDNELIDYYRRSSVYVQASLHEGFGLSVAEAMLAGCIPVVTRAGSLPEVVGDCGFFCETSAPAAVADCIQVALKSSPDARLRARERVLKEFPMDKRGKALLAMIQNCSPTVKDSLVGTFPKP